MGGPGASGPQAGSAAARGVRLADFEPSGPSADRIVLIVVDTLRGDRVGVEGLETPNLDALAEEGQRVPDALASYHQTTMSMGALFTGRTPSLESAGGGIVEWNGRTWCGLSRFGGDDEAGCIPRGVPTLGEIMQKAGYRTIGLVGNELLFAPSGLERGFDVWHEMAGRARAATARRPGAGLHAVNFRLRQELDARTSDRFFLYVHYMDVHDFRSMRATYDHQVERVDWAIGDVVKMLKERDLWEGTFLVVTADHGHRMGEKHFTKGGRGHRGNPSFEEVLQVPLIVVPAVLGEGARGLRGQDTFELLLAQAGIEAPRDALLEADELFVSEVRWQTYRRGRWKSYRHRKGGQHRLIDLETDPAETKNVAPRYPEVVEAHRARMDALAAELAGAPPDSSLSAEDERRLRALGYLE